jgi:MFS family permease
MYSLGALIGAVAGGALIWTGLSPTAHVAILLVLSLAATFVFAPRLPQETEALSDSEAEAASVSRTWRLPLVALGLLAACAAIPEGAVADWVGIYLRETVLAPHGGEALGFAGFSLMMLIGRLFGDRLSELWGPVRLGQLGSSLAVVGLALALGLPSVVPVVGGFALMGLGISVLAPLAFSAVGRIAPHNTGGAIAGVTAFFYIGYLAGPPVIGVLAHFGSLRAALGLLVLTAVLAACLSPVLREKPMAQGKAGPA